MISDILSDFGVTMTKGAGRPASRLGSTPTRKAPTNNPAWKSAIVICPDSLVLREVEIDVANAVDNGTWFPTRDGGMITSRFLAHPGMRPRLEELVHSLEIQRTAALHAENKLIGKLFGLALLSRKALVNPNTAPVAVTDDMFCKADAAGESL